MRAPKPRVFSYCRTKNGRIHKHRTLGISAFLSFHIVKEGNLIALSQDSTLWIGAMKSLDGSRPFNRVRD